MFKLRQEDKILGLFKFRVFADNKINYQNLGFNQTESIPNNTIIVAQMMISVCYRVEITVGKGVKCWLSVFFCFFHKRLLSWGR